MAIYIEPGMEQEYTDYTCTECKWSGTGDELVDHGDGNMCCPDCGSKYIEEE